MHHLLIFFGTRPEITKLAPIIRKAVDRNLELTLIHSGQHYDKQLSEVFLEELEIPKVKENLVIGSGSHGYQTAKMIENYEAVILKYKPDIVLGLGDTNSVVAAGIVCSKLNVPFGHIEAGIRSFDLTMPEEINRRFAGVGAAIHFAPTEQAVINLYYEGLPPDRIFLTGNTTVDATIEHAETALKKSKIAEKLKIDKEKPLIVVTAHRAANVDNKKSLEQICFALSNLKEFSIVFPVHPRTLKYLNEFKLLSILEEAEHIVLTEPLGYFDFMYLMQMSSLIVTDSGGLQEEAITLKKPCVTLRTNTERPETVQLGVNFLVGTDSLRIIDTVRKVIVDKNITEILNTIENPFGDGKASIRILEIIEQKLTDADLPFKPPEFLKTGAAEYQLVKIKSSTTKTEIEKEYEGMITLAYNEKGKPKPIPEKIPKDWIIRIQK